MYKVIDLELSNHLKNHGFSRIAIEADTLVIVYNGTSIRCDIEQSWNKTIEGFKKYSKDLIPKKETLQGVISFISEKWLDLSDEQRKRAEEHWEKDQANAVEERARREEEQKRQQEQKQQDQQQEEQRQQQQDSSSLLSLPPNTNPVEYVFLRFSQK
jgi:phytoene dehydrogenase-like protein